MKSRIRKIEMPDTDSSLRSKRLVVMINDREARIINDYLEKNRILNKSTWARETILHFIYRNMVEDYPTLFDEHDMRR